MPALRTLGLVILSALAVSIGIMGFFYMRAVLDQSAARDAALRVLDACGTVIATGSTRNVRITIPGDYRMKFFENRIFVDNYSLPEGGLSMRFSDGSPELGPGSHDLSITVNDGRLVVTRI
jgi:hypothetical protein